MNHCQAGSPLQDDRLTSQKFTMDALTPYLAPMIR
jgi:hypothetical protein